MAGINTIGASLFAKLHLSKLQADINSFNALAIKAYSYTDGDADNLMGAVDDDDGDARELTNIREFPTFGSPQNTVSVPTYGQHQANQITAQSDGGTLDFVINYVPDSTEHKWIYERKNDQATLIGGIILQNNNNASPQKNIFFFKGQVGSITVTPSLTDAITATVSFTTIGDFLGPYNY